jgi:hypothetical protein
VSKTKPTRPAARPESDAPEEPTEYGPPCPRCGGQTVLDRDARPARPVCLDCVLISVPADAPPARPAARSRDRKPTAPGVTMTAYPPPPEVPAGATLTHLILYSWSDPPAPVAMARDAAGALLACEWDHGRGWLGWKPNDVAEL